MRSMIPLTSVPVGPATTTSPSSYTWTWLGRRERDAVGRYSGPRFEQWKNRNLEMQRKSDAHSSPARLLT